jgi:AraC family transcriptional regulator
LFTAHHIEISGSEPFDFAWEGGSHYLALHDIRRKDGETFVQGSRSVEADVRDKITFLPAGCPVTGWTHPARQRNSFTSMTFSAAAMTEELGHRYRPESMRPLLYFQDATLGATLGKLERAVKDPGGSDELYAETLGLLVLLELQNVLASRPIEAATRRHTLSPEQLRQAEDFIEANLGRAISLGELAALANLSRFHFCRLFKGATGRSPLQYVLDRRLTKAQSLLSEGKLPVAEIAQASGFRGVSQFSRAFSRRVGVTPSRYRQSV